MQIFYADPAAFDDAFLRRVTPLLPAEKQAAIAKIRHLPSKKQAILAWALLLYAVQLRAPGEPLPPLGFTEAGKPFFVGSNLHFNLSHTETLAALALSDAPVGVDVQTLTPASDGVRKRVLSEGEQQVYLSASDPADAFTTFWTQKEAFGKQTGEGIAQDLRALDFAPYFGLNRFTRNDCRFSVFRLCGAVLTVCADADAQKPQQVTRAMLEKVLFASNHG